jgi:phage shock protein C
MTTQPPPDDTTSAAAAVPTADAGTAPPPGPKRLTRSRTDEWFGGVAGGLAEYFDTDPTLIRVAFVVAAILTSGFAIVGYIIAWIVIPEAGEEDAGGAAPATRKRRGSTGALVWGGILIIGGTLLLINQLDVDIPFPSLRVMTSIALILVGVVMLIEARRGFHGGLMALAIILTLILGASAATSFNLAVDGAFGDQRHNVTQVSDLRNSYSHAFGTVTLDLRNLELPPGRTRVEVSAAFGEATVLLPRDVAFRLNGSSAFGSIDAPGFSTGGIVSSRSYTSPGYSDAERRLDIDLSVAFGSGRVRQ